MPAIIDSLSREDKLKLIRERLVPGRILYLHCDFTTPPKPKFLLLVSVEQPGPLLFVINSEISRFVRNRPHLLLCQVRLRASEYSCLSHDSFVDCKEAWSVAAGDIIAQLLPEMGRLLDEINPDTRREVIAAVELARTLARRHKEPILRSLD